MTDSVFSPEELEFMKSKQAPAPVAQTTKPAPVHSQSVAKAEAVPAPQAVDPDMKKLSEEAGSGLEETQKAAPSAIGGAINSFGPAATVIGTALAAFMLGRNSSSGGGSTQGETSRVEPTMSEKPLSIENRTVVGPNPTDVPAYLRKQQNAPVAGTVAAPEVPAPIVEGITAEQAAQHVAQIPEHPNPITHIKQSDLNMIGASETAKIEKGLQPPATPSTGVAPTPIAAVESTAGQTTKAPAKPSKKAEQHTYKSIADIPEGMVFRPDVGNLDRSLVNILGPEHRLYAKELLNEGKMFGHSSDVNKDVSRLTTEYFQKLQQEIPETILSRDARKAQNIESKFGTYGSLLGKAAKVGGVAGTLMTIAQAANAREAARNVGESLLPIALTPSSVESGTLTQKELNAFKEAQKLGSPYRSVPPPKR